MALTDHVTLQPNVAQVFELREKPEPAIIMAYYPRGNMVDALILDEAQRMSVLARFSRLSVTSMKKGWCTAISSPRIS